MKSACFTCYEEVRTKLARLESGWLARLLQDPWKCTLNLNAACACVSAVKKRRKLVIDGQVEPNIT